MATRARGLSLIEMVVVVAIIILLASLAFPVYARAKENAKIVRSKSNMRQLALLIRQYAEDQNGSGPLGLGLPHSAAAFYRRPIPVELISTGGSNWQSPGSTNAAYNWMLPDLVNLAPGPNLDSRLAEWQKHMSRTNENPVLLVDATFPLETGPFAKKRIFGVHFDSSIKVRKYAGKVSMLDPWE